MKSLKYLHSTPTCVEWSNTTHHTVQPVDFFLPLASQFAVVLFVVNLPLAPQRYHLRLTT